MIISLSTVISVATLNNLGYSIEKYEESPGVYYENKVVSELYNIEWRIVVYVNLNKIDNQLITPNFTMNRLNYLSKIRGYGHIAETIIVRGEVVIGGC